MLLRPFLLIAVLSLNVAAQPSWRLAGACVTPDGTLCRTLVYESSGWVNSGWGFHAVDRYADRTTAAVRSDGAALLRIVHRGFKYHVVPSGNYDRTRIVFPGQQRTIEIEN